MPTIKFPKNPNVDTAFVEQDDGTKNRALMIAPQDISTLELPNNPNSTKGYITVDGQKQRVILTADITGGGGGGSGLPDQTGHSGEFLTTDGSSASWSDKPLVNTATGSNSLTIGGTATSTTESVNIGMSSSVSGRYSTAIGQWTEVAAEGGTAVGRHASVKGSRGTAVGMQATASSNAQFGIAIGFNTIVAANYAIQLGGIGPNSGSLTNSDANTFKVGNSNGNFEMMSADGTIPEARLADTTNAQQGDVLTLDANGDAVWQAGGGGGIQNTATGTNALTIMGTACQYSYGINIGYDSAFGSSNSSNSIAIGRESSVTGSSSVAIGLSATITNSEGVCIGDYATNSSNMGVSVGSNADASGAHLSTALGGYAKATESHAIQIGHGTNSEAGSLYIGTAYNNADVNYKLLDSDGTIPTARLTKVNSTITLVAADWSGGSQTVTVSGVTSSSIVWVSPDPTDQSAYVSAGILCTAQGTDSLTFTATTTPSADIDVVVVAM